MSKCCPTCGQPVLDLPENLPRLTPIQMTMINRLQKAGRHGVRSDLLYQAVYNNHIRSPDVMKVHVYNLRKKLEGTGLAIESFGWGRSRDELATYRLVQK